MNNSAAGERTGSGQVRHLSFGNFSTTLMIVIGTGLLLTVVGCHQAAGERNTTAAIVTEETTEAQAETLPAETTTSFIIPTPTSTSTPVSSLPTPQPTLTPSPVETMPPTPWPTLPPDEAASKVWTLLADNQNPGCLLPCWWGATPGQTHWQDIEPFLNSIAVKMRTTPLSASVTLPLPQSIAVPGFDYNIVYAWNESKIIEEIAVDAINIPGYDPKTMLPLYGIPEEVWLKTIAEPREGVLPFQLIIVYQQQGISFRYYVDAMRTSESVTACFEPSIEGDRPDLFPAGPRIYLWEPGQHKEIGEISPIPWESYFPLESKTELTPETFYERFTNPNERPCLETPEELWP